MNKENLLSEKIKVLENELALKTRELEIEAALEKVRSRSLAMHKSDELQEVITTVLHRLNELGIAMDSASINLPSQEKQEFMVWIASKNHDYSEGFRLPFGLKSVIARDWDYIFSAETDHFFRQYSKEEKDDYYRELFEHSDFRHIPQARKDFLMSAGRYGVSGAVGKYSTISTFSYSGKTLNSEEIEVLKRFLRVFEQAYIRFLDLQKAEQQAYEAIKQVSLDRVRGEIATMRTVDDLQRITPIIWHELTALGIPFVRCGVFIIDEATEHIQVHLSSPNGSSLGALKLPYDSSELIVNTVNHWRQGIIFKTHWNKQEFLSFMQSMIKLGQISSPKTYQGAAAPPESLNLHFVPFKQGMLYVGNIQPLTKDELELVRSLAEAFSMAYARYEDFKKLEIAKQSIEKTLSELRATQSQLIQSEKMASLGELTAGIAHEIQNPLNFVNNFSEISKELLGEMKEELSTGSKEEAITIANDVIQNLEKINHHGKRADAIVKGMLQHSRTSSGVKEPTDINALADEYLRLAYHGLRAKDKSFNADFKTNFNPDLPKINVVPQDIGRVLLNLINNAFYAVSERNKKGEPGFAPTVTVTTRLTANSQLLIAVKDNGSGIPPHIVDKIFQPFFTTKPTGQGTGLGLSMSYEIITKGHGGELLVETLEGEGSVFVIHLPI